MANLELLKREGCEPTGHIWSRRNFLGLAGWASVLGSLGAGLVAFLRFLYPRVLYEPSTIVKLGRPEEYARGTVSDRWLKTHRLWVLRFRDGSIAALQARCTHLGCTPMYLATENKFKCPCHGSGFRGIDAGQGGPNWAGASFEGPAPRPLERLKIGLAEDGQIVVDTAVVFQGELEDRSKNWEAPDALLKT